MAESARASGQLAKKPSLLLLPMSAVVRRAASVAVDFESSRRSYCPPQPNGNYTTAFWGVTAALIFPTTSAAANSNTRALKSA